MKLYGGLLSPFVMRVALGARFKGLDLPVESFEGGIKSEAYLKLNPLGKMPLLVDGDFALPESAVILDYVDEVGGGASLYPGDAKTRARVRLVARLADLYLMPEIGTLFRARQDPSVVPGALEKIGKVLGDIAHFRNEADSFAVGDSFTAADATLIPMFFFLDAFAMMGTGKLLDAQPGLKGWWERAKASDLGKQAVEQQDKALKAFMGG